MKCLSPSVLTWSRAAKGTTCVVRVVGNKSLKKSGSFICSSDSEIIGYALDTLYNVISNDLEEEEQGKCLVAIAVLTVEVLPLVFLFKS